jgi:hypothetical protein
MKLNATLNISSEGRKNLRMGNPSSFLPAYRKPIFRTGIQGMIMRN